MNEWFKKMAEKIKELWTKTSIIQKVILFGLIAAVIAVIVVTATVSSRPTGTRLFIQPINDTVQRTRILDRINQENVNATISSDGYITVDNEITARRMRDVLISEGLIPSNVDPFASFYDRSWSTTDADQNVKKQQAIQEQLRQHIEAIDDITSANVTLVLPENKLFTSEQNPVSASVIIRAKPASDLLYNKGKIRGIQSIVLMAVEGLREENLTIADSSGNVLNDFAGMAEMDRIEQVARQQRVIREMQEKLRMDALRSLRGIFTEDRVRDLSVKIDMNMSKRSTESTVYSPITIREDNPDTPYDDSEFRDTLPISSQTVTREWQGTGFNPEGPAGVEGQTPPVYSDMSNVIGRSTETGVTQNNVINTTHINEETSPTIDRVTVSVGIDGTWAFEYDENGKRIVNPDGETFARVFTPVPREDLERVANLLQGAIGSDGSRNYRVFVEGFQFDREKEFHLADAAYFASQQRRITILLILACVAVVLIGFIIFRIVAREMERRRRLREERLLKEQQEAREAALWEARNQGVEVTMSVEESRSQELQQNAISMAKEHPEEVAMLLRTWLMEEG